MSSHLDTDRDVLLTGMGFCLPGRSGMTATAEQFWEVISQGWTFDHTGEVRFGEVTADVPEEVRRRFPSLSPGYLANYSRPQMFALVALAEATADAGLSIERGDLAAAGVLCARYSMDAPVTAQDDVIRTDPATLSHDEARALCARLAVSAQFNDATMAQISVLRCDGPSMTVTAGCAAGGVMVGLARHLIASGQVDLVVVTGAEFYDARRTAGLTRVAERAMEDLPEGSVVGLSPSPMRPYDVRANGLNTGHGAACLVLESRRHAEARGARPYARVLAQATRRSPISSTLAVDPEGRGLSLAMQQCLDEAGLEPYDVGYVNGGAEGSPIFHDMESRAYRAVFGDRVESLPVSVQEACFGHSGSPLGCIGVAATALMLARQELCPTAGCEQPDPRCAFDPLPGGSTRPTSLEHAVSVNTGIGMISSAVLLGR